MKKLKIAVVSPFPPSKGTLNEYAYHLVSHFRQKREVEQLVLITDKLTDGSVYRSEGEGAPVQFEEAWTFNSVQNPFTILKAVRKHQPDIVFFNIHFLSFGDKKLAAALGLLTPLLSRIMGFKSVVLLHNIVESVDLSSAGMTNNRLLKWIFNLFGTLLTFCLLCSNMLAVTISKYVKILEKKYKTKNVALLPHGSFEMAVEPDFSIPEGPKKIMTFGKFGTYKKVEDMIKAVEIVRERTGEDLEIVIAGTDSPNKKGYLQNVKQEFSHVPQITFTGYVEEEDVPKVFKESAVVVFPYTSTTGSSGVLHQAGNYGKACIMPNIGDLKALIEEEGYEGEFFMPADVNSLADGIENLILDDQKRIEMGRKNFAAATSLPMADIADWYMLHFRYLVEKKKWDLNAVISSVFSILKPRLNQAGA